jgi:hypothetical protein
MVILGECERCEDGITRPIVRVKVPGVEGTSYTERFLIDPGADRTVFSAAFLDKLRLPGTGAQSGVLLKGIGGGSPHVLVITALEFTRDDGGSARVRGEFAAFTDLTATDMSILGRDVLDNFDVIISRRRDQVLLLAGNHRYQVMSV